MLADFQNFFTVVFFMKFATKSMLCFSSYLKGMQGTLPCKTHKTKIGEILLHVEKKCSQN